MLTEKDINRLFEEFNKTNILVIGDVMLDSYLWGHVERISPEAPVPIVSVNKRESRLGGAANVALNLQSLGANPIICSIIGNDSRGEEFTELLKKQKLTDAGILKSKNRITTTKFRVLGNNAQLLRVDEEMDTDITEKETNELYKKIESLINKKTISAIIFEDYDKGLINKTLIDKVVKLANSLKIFVTVDPKKKNFNFYKNVSLFKPNLKELKEGLKIDIDTKNIKDINKAASILHSRNKIDIVLLTLASEGVYISKKSKTNISKLIPAHKRNIADVSGAGDTVISVATLCLAAGLAVEDVARISNLAGGLVCEQVGVVPIQKDILKKAIIRDC
jgi:D-glycero-beta-D-manno-heptose-7-phosphate kinase